ncbi:PREDICTED: uncharacterized protein LOC106116870 isoform X2 [Papilio xuthus]|uniref:Uncharacterized protein LOC106116870 isoform X2 n=1 Tax=Papilio xuthus TaxID=66420 RepID=A0AAJ6Z6S0_PAPXU|nr:PREDICTED: uncharacterized protein LOC106116870 isoform X2 [Papilio xuthus]
MFKRVCSQTKISLRHVNRPYSESDIERPAPPPQPCRRSASSPPLTLTLDSELEDDVFVSPRTNSGSDPFSTTNLEIFRYGSPRTPAGLLLSPRRERSFTFSVTSEKHWRDKGGTDVADGVTSTDVTDSSSLEEPYQTEKSSSESIFSSIIPDKLSGSICTAVIFMLGWKLLANKR